MHADPGKQEDPRDPELAPLSPDSPSLPDAAGAASPLDHNSDSDHPLPEPEPTDSADADASLPVSTREKASLATRLGRKPSTKLDPWAHRRGEPRIFALFWTIFLFITTLSIFFAAMAGPIVTPELMRPAAKMLLLLTVVGIAVLWPMVRLSQAPDRAPIGGTFQDFVVIMVPTQALIWPQTLWWLARWPLSTVLALAAGIALWGLLIAGLLAFVQAGRVAAPASTRQPLQSAGWMLVFVGVSVVGLLISLLRGGLAVSAGALVGGGDIQPVELDSALMLSPLGIILELTRDASWSGRATPLTPGHWKLIGVVGLAAACVWFAAGRRLAFCTPHPPAPPDTPIPPTPGRGVGKGLRLGREA